MAFEIKIIRIPLTDDGIHYVAGAHEEIKRILELVEQHGKVLGVAIDVDPSPASATYIYAKIEDGFDLGEEKYGLIDLG